MKNVKVLLVAIALVIFALPPLVAAGADDEGPVLSVDFRDANIQDVATFISIKAGANIVVEKGVTGLVNIRLSDVPWLEALTFAAKQVGCTVGRDENGVYLISTPHFSFTTKAEGVSLKQVISLLAQQSGQNIVVSPDVEAVVHFTLRDVPWQIALATIVKTAGPYSLVRDESGVYRVVPDDALTEQLETKVFKLRYIQPPSEYKPLLKSEFAEKSGGDSTASRNLKEDFTLFKAIDQVIAENGSVEYDFDSNAFIVTSTKPLLDSVTDIIKLVDVKPDQVFIDVKFVTTVHTDLINAGVRYPKGFMISGSGGSVVHRLPFNLGSGGWEDSLAVTGDGPSALEVSDFLGGESPYTFGVLDFSNISPVLEFLANDSESEIVQAPQLTVIDNKSATVFVGEQIHFAEEFAAAGQSGGLEKSIREASKNSPVKVGTQLMVMPHIVPGSDSIILQVIPTSDQLTGTSSTNVIGFERFTVGDSHIDLPRLSSRTIVTSLMLKDGQTAVLGGLISQNRTYNKNKLPFFGDIPIIGWLFKNKQVSTGVNNLYIFITVRIIRDDADMQTLFDEYDVAGAHIKPYKRGMEVKSIPDELKEIEAEKLRRISPVAPPDATEAGVDMEAPELGPDVLGRGWEETEHGIEEFEIKK